MERRERTSVVVSALLLLPAVLFVSANLLKYNLHIRVVSDVLGPFAEPRSGIADATVTVLILAGPLVALVIAVLPIVQIRLAKTGDRVEAAVSVRLRWARISVALVALAVLFVLAGHILAENLACWFGDAKVC